MMPRPGPRGVSPCHRTTCGGLSHGLTWRRRGNAAATSAIQRYQATCSRAVTHACTAPGFKGLLAQFGDLRPGGRHAVRRPLAMGAGASCAGPACPTGASPITPWHQRRCPMLPGKIAGRQTAARRDQWPLATPLALDWTTHVTAVGLSPLTLAEPDVWIRWLLRAVVTACGSGAVMTRSSQCR